MAKVDVAAHGGGGERRPPLTPEVLGSPDVAVLTIHEARTGLPTESGRKAAFVVFAETPDYNYWLNKTGIAALVERLGDDDANWPGQKVPLLQVRVTNPQTGQPTWKFHVAAPEDWDDLLAAAAKRRKRSRK